MINISSDYILSKIPTIPKYCIVTGSGLSEITSIISKTIKINFNEVPGFFCTTVKGHEGYLIFGYINNCPVLLSVGRYHYYEGYTIDQVSIPIKVFSNLGIKKIILTNSAGCINKNYIVGQLLIIKKFLDCSYIKNNKSPKRIDIKNGIILNKKIIEESKIKINFGTYAWVLGPTYETIAETKDLINLGADAVGMSTYPEYYQAKKLKMKVLILSYLSNYVGGTELITHQDVLNESKKHIKEISLFIKEIIK